MAVKAITIDMGIHRELHLDSVRKKPYSEADIARIEAFAEELMNEKITSKFYTLGIPYEMERINSSVYAMATEPIAYSLLALDKMRKRAADDVEKHQSLFTMRYLNPAKALVRELIGRQSDVTNAEVCQIAHINEADIQRAHHIDSIISAPQQMMSMMMSMANEVPGAKQKVVTHSSTGKSSKGGRHDKTGKMAKMQEIMTSIRGNAPKDIAGTKVVAFADYEASEKTDLVTGEKTKIELPKSNVLTVYLEDGASIVIRPSGTEPKIKIYYTTIGKTNEEAAAIQAKYAEAFTKLVKG